MLTHNLPHFDNRVKPLHQVVYHTYPPMFQYFYHLENLGVIVINDALFGDNTTNYPYEKEKYGLIPFGLNRQKRILFTPSKKLPPIEHPEIMPIFIPTKQVVQPPSRFK